MAEARSHAAWSHTAAILAILANTHRDPKKSRPFQVADFHPHLRAKSAPKTTVGVAALKAIFVDRGGK